MYLHQASRFQLIAPTVNAASRRMIEIYRVNSLSRDRIPFCNLQIAAPQTLDSNCLPPLSLSSLLCVFQFFCIPRSIEDQAPTRTTLQVDGFSIGARRKAFGVNNFRHSPELLSWVLVSIMFRWAELTLSCYKPINKLQLRCV